MPRRRNMSQVGIVIPIARQPRVASTTLMDLSASSTAVAPVISTAAQKWCRWGISAPVGGAAAHAIVSGADLRAPADKLAAIEPGARTGTASRIGGR